MEAKIDFDNSPFGEKHNGLFRPGPNIDLNACVGRNGGPAGFDRYANGYFQAGAWLVERLRENPRSVDSVIYPLVMLYRHGIEIALKHLGRVLPPHCNQAVEVKLTHKLLDNWRIVRRLLNELSEHGEVLDRIDSILNDIVEIDPSGENFRYPETKDGSHVLQDTSIINVEVFGDAIDFAARYFEGACYWAHHLADMRAEQMAYEWEMKAEQMAYEWEMQRECEQEAANYS